MSSIAMTIIKKLYTKLNSILKQHDYIPYLIIIGIVFGILVFKNFPFNTWFTGWDNLHPEFNFGLNIKRALNAVWQTNQGLGTFGGHGYAATLPHTILLFFMSFVLPDQYLRSSFTFLTLIVGVLGVFFLVRKIIPNTNSTIQNTSALGAALFYMLNLATVENYFIQLEAFIIHFAVLPWLILITINTLEKCNKKNLIIFFVINLIATSQGFIPPLFFVYMMIFSLILFSYLIANRNIKALQKTIVLFLLTFCINAYWFLPVTYYSFTHNSTYLQAYNNLTSTDDFISKNKKYGNIADVIQLKGFVLDAPDSNEDGSITYIFSPWKTHISNPIVISIGNIFFACITIGLIYILFIKNKKYYHIAIAASTIIIFSLLATDTPPFSLVSYLFQQIPILKQAFRVAFTKFSISLAFFYAILFGIGLSVILKKIKENTIQFCFICAAIFVIIITYSIPSFQGNFLYQRTKLQIPSQYFELFNFFKNQNINDRIANFPQGWHWGWSMYKWGYSGSGFLWYGIEQPIMDRAFDVWGKYNENYYWELTYAMYSENYPLLDSVLAKYNIHWVIFDKNIVPYPNAKWQLTSDQVENYLNTSSKYSLVKTINPTDAISQKIIIYRVNAITGNSVNHILSQVKNIGPTYSFSNYDQAYFQNGDYYTNNSQPYDLIYPYRSLFSNREPITSPQNIYELNDSINIIGTDNSKYSILKNTVVYTSQNDPDFLNHQALPCDDFKEKNSKFNQEFTLQKSILFTSLNSSNCYNIMLNDLSQRDGYILKIVNKHISGTPLQLAIINNDSKKAEIEVLLNSNNNVELNYIIIPPMKYYGLGYTISINNKSIGDIESSNKLLGIEIYPINYFDIVNKSINTNPNTINNSIYVFNQSYDDAWKAYNVSNLNFINSYFPFIFGTELKEHVLVNNWANGWRLRPAEQDYGDPKGTNIVIIFWPQYLEYLGLLFLPIGLIYIIKYAKI